MAGVRGGAMAIALALSLACAVPAAAAPRGGERYDGLSATGQRIYLTVRKDGRRLARYTFHVDTPCSDGRTRLQGLLHPGEGPARIRRDGSFRYTSPAWRGSHRTPSGRVRGRLRLTFSGAFDAAGDSASGTIRATFRSRRLDCSSGPVGFTVHRDGTPAAPWRDAVMATGRYSASGRGVEASIRTLAPARELIRAHIAYRVRCRTGGGLRSGRIFRFYGLSEEGTLRTGGRARFRIERAGVTVRARLRLTLRFFQQDGYRVEGVWRIRAFVSRGGRRIDTCSMRRPFSGSFVRGPA